MTIAEFLVEFQDTIQSEETITQDTILADLEEWESMAVMSSIAWFELNLEVKVAYADFENLKTIQDIINLAQGKIA